MWDDEFFASFVGYGVEIHNRERERVMFLDVVSNHVWMHAKVGSLAVPAIALDSFITSIQVHKQTLEALVRQSAENVTSSVTRGRFAAETSSAGPVVEDRLTGGTLHLVDGSSVGQLVRELKHAHRALKGYVAPCWRLANSIERLPYEGSIAGIERDGYSTVHIHGVARLHMGKIDFRRVGRVVKVHPSADPHTVRIEEA
jgi:hypothetical protein